MKTNLTFKKRFPIHPARAREFLPIDLNSQTESLLVCIWTSSERTTDPVGPTLQRSLVEMW